MNKITPYQVNLLNYEYKRLICDEVLKKYNIPVIENIIDCSEVDQETFYKIYKEFIAHNILDKIAMHVDALRDCVRDDIDYKRGT